MLITNATIASSSSRIIRSTKDRTKQASRTAWISYNTRMYKLDAANHRCGATQSDLPAFPRRCWRSVPILDVAGCERLRVRSRYHWVRWVPDHSVDARWRRLADTSLPHRRTDHRILCNVHTSDGNDGCRQPARPYHWYSGCSRRILLRTASGNPSRSKARRPYRKEEREGKSYVSSFYSATGQDKHVFVERKQILRQEERSCRESIDHLSQRYTSSRLFGFLGMFLHVCFIHAWKKKRILEVQRRMSAMIVYLA